jgi:hypothetical protein
MLSIKKISHFDAYMEQWKKERLGKFTASMIGKLVSQNSHKGVFSAGAITYIECVAGEILTGKPAKAEFHTDYTDYGNATEAEAITYFQKVKGFNVLRDTERMDTHRLIINDEFTACTPDALIAMVPEKNLFDPTGEFIKVAPLEVKCPPVLHRFIKLYKCNTPQDLKNTEPLYYYQALSQLSFVDSLIGYFGCYNPDFPTKGKIIEFKKIELTEDLKNLNMTIDYAKKEVIKIIKMFTDEQNIHVA